MSGTSCIGICTLDPLFCHVTCPPLNRKTQNVFLSRGRKLVKLGDFGIAKVLGSQTNFAQTVSEAEGDAFVLNPGGSRWGPHTTCHQKYARIGRLLYRLATRLTCSFQIQREVRHLVAWLPFVRDGSSAPPV